jgi:glyoxylase-like metal-dependent hydrolase (beta-lactamase superfamily II)
MPSRVVAVSVVEGMGRGYYYGDAARDAVAAYHRPVARAADWVEVGDRVFSRRYAVLDQQIGLILGDGQALVVDTRTVPSHAREILVDARRLTPLPVQLVINTHWHSDHAWGNHEFRPATIWGHERCRTRLLEEGERRRDEMAASIPDFATELATVVIDAPDRTFTDAATIAVGGRPLELRFLGRGHTDADIVVRVPDAGILFAGDLLENDAVPWFGDSYPLEWPATVERMLGLVDGPVVPGHGSIGDRAFVERQLAEFRAIVDAAERLHAGHTDRDGAMASMPYTADASAMPLDRALAQLRGELD